MHMIDFVRRYMSKFAVGRRNTNAARIFNRVRDKSHPLYRILLVLERTDKFGQAVAANFRHDPRVSEDREQTFVELWQRRSKGLFWKYIFKRFCARRFSECYAEYVFTRVQSTPDPCFEYSSNWNNLTKTPTETLVSVFGINGLSRMFVWAKDPGTRSLGSSPGFLEGLELFRDYPNDPSILASLAFVDAQMRDRASREKFLSLLVELYEVYRKQCSYHPIWLTKWQEFRPCWHATIKGKDRGDRWSQWVGVSTEMKEKHWVVVLKFEPSRFNKVYRPTTLDTTNRYHFPTPEETVFTDGIAADLNISGWSLACELIAKFPSLLNAEIDLDYGCAQLLGQALEPIDVIRQHHVKKLQGHFRNASVPLEWLARVSEGEV